MNYFELFNLPVTIKVDKAILSKKFIELQKQFHPDFFTLATDEEQADALEKSSELNKALQILKSEELTLHYILKQKGVLEDDEKYQLPQDFLMEVMDLNEGLNNESAKQINAFENSIYADVKELMVHYDNETITAKELAILKEYYFKKKYLQRILERLGD